MSWLIEVDAAASRASKSHLKHHLVKLYVLVLIYWAQINLTKLNSLHTKNGTFLVISTPFQNCL